LKNLIDRSIFFRQYHVPLIVLPIFNSDETVEVLQSEEGSFVTYPNLAFGYPTLCEWHTESFTGRKYRVLQRTGLIKMSDALSQKDNDWMLAPKKMRKLLFALTIMYLLGVGDTGFCNILADVDQHKIYIIDFDENASQDRDGEVFYFSKAPAKTTLDQCLTAARPIYPQIIAELQPFLSYPNHRPRTEKAIRIFSESLKAAIQPPVAVTSTTLRTAVLPYLTDAELSQRSTTIDKLKEAMKAGGVSFTG
jgi:hypothetical protein